MIILNDNKKGDMGKYDFEPTIGLEIHVQLKTKSKMFCGCNNFSVDSKPNTNICSVCTGQPGVLPVANKQAVMWTLLACLALSCKVNEISKFDRKHYFYPDLPKGYQISQFDQPFGENGVFEINIDGVLRKIRIKRIHLEEDAGKLLHPAGSDFSLVDLNRAGTPLLEIVTEPDIKSPKEARVFMTELRKMMRYLGVSDANMEQGNLRADANISMALKESETLGVKVEIKNMNSFKFMETALNHEIERQTKRLMAGEKITQETRGFIESSGETVSQRNKEEAMDYRYMPEPDLPIMRIKDVEGVGGKEINLAEIRKELPELPIAKKQRYQTELGISALDAEQLTNDYDLANYFEKVVENVGQKTAQKAVNWILSSLLEFLNKNYIAIVDSPVTSENLGKLIKIVEEGKLNNRMAKEVLDEMFSTGLDPEKVIEIKGMGQVSDFGELEKLVEQVIFENPNQVIEFKSGKEQVIGFLMGQVMKLTQGRANPKIASEMLKEKMK